MRAMRGWLLGVCVWSAAQAAEPTLTLVSGHGPDLRRIRADYDENLHALEPHFDSFRVDDEGVPLMLRAWSLLGDWLAIRAEQPGGDGGVADITPDQLVAWTKELHGGLEADALQLDAQSWVLNVWLGEVGDVLVLHESQGKLRVAQRLDQLGRERGAPRSLRCWGLQGPDGGCAFHGQLLALPRDAAHRPRFVLVATYAQGAGGTSGSQLTVYAWDGRALSSLLTGSYAHSLDQAGPRLEDDVLHVATKESWKTMFSCGTCAEPEADWRIQVTPTSVQSQGRHRQAPELELVDDLFSRVLHRAAVGEVADPAVGKLLRQELEASKESHALGMLDEYRITPLGDGKTEVCVLPDTQDRYVFTLAKAAGKWRAVAVRKQPKVSCGAVPDASGAGVPDAGAL